MNVKKPLPLTPVVDRKICPICQKRSYSASGIHPQCAATKADRERKEELKAAELAAESAPAKPKSSTSGWRKNRCPRCGTEVAVRLKVCTCGRPMR